MADSADLLFEIGTEELPPKALKGLAEALLREFLAGLGRADLTHGFAEYFATPRRLAIMIKDCSFQQPDRKVEKRGPSIKAAFDSLGKPSKPAEGFARSCGVNVQDLIQVQTDKGDCLAFVYIEQGRKAVTLLPGIAESALAKLPIPKRMRWGSSEVQFVRPVHWLLFLHGSEVIPCTLLDAHASNFTYGHRFHHPDAILIASPGEYAEALRLKGHVIPRLDERIDRIRDLVVQAAESLGGRADLDADLLDEVAALNEWPVPIVGSFEPRFLEVPHEALVLTMKLNQKYFPIFDAKGMLMNHFITIANIDSPYPELIKEGNERVVRPRLSDAMFFWQRDGRKRLEDHIESLKQVVFQKQLGSMYDKSLRVSCLAAFIADHINADAKLAERAALLSRCDLMTEMVLEFPEMQGIMGRYMAMGDGEPPQIIDALAEFYLPRFSGDRLPLSLVGIAVSLADKIDTLVGIFSLGLKPSGDKDPYALRRAALGILRIILENQIDINLIQLLSQAEMGLAKIVRAEAVTALVYDFMMDRLKGIYLERGFSADICESVLTLRPSNPNDVEYRMTAVASFRKLVEADALTAANKRIRNILRKAEIKDALKVDAALFREDAEIQLYHRLRAIKSTVSPLLQQGNYSSVLKELSRLRDAVDHFFDEVMVMAEAPAIRNNRLALLQDIYRQFLKVADISCLQGQG
ncbi:MAG: glycine--tRNA ligase subunit beta [Gammaproteobacteria bacterium]|nr:glycine--tRNA ligase subunit beta [Gammaproteobacteria bacterium]MBU1656201.1 glycine--tRNA ligase subunit beta [Gammaproteobacteria bacterium]MBU1959766.1 glycine--tRNA ligase subunit beta [Gammaproteobacteria bacterium]